MKIGNVGTGTDSLNNDDVSVESLLISSLHDNPYFQLLRYGFLGSRGSSKNSNLSRNRIECHVCGENNTTLLKDGEKDGKTIYICKDCKMLQGLYENDEE